MGETDCTQDQANAAIQWLQTGFASARVVGDERIFWPDESQVAAGAYTIVDQIMPHDGDAVPGSAHAALAALFGPGVTLTHTMRDQVYCEFEWAFVASN